MQVICKKNNLIYDNQPHYFASITIGKSYELLNVSHNPKFRVYGGELKTLFYEIVDNSGLRQKNYNSPLAQNGVWFYNSTDAIGDDDKDDNFTLRINVIENALIYLDTHNGA